MGGVHHRREYDLTKIPERTFGSYVKEAREKLGWSHQQVVKFLHLKHGSQISNYEHIAFTVHHKTLPIVAPLFRKAGIVVPQSYPERMNPRLAALLRSRDPETPIRKLKEPPVNRMAAALKERQATNGHHVPNETPEEPRQRTRIAPQVPCPTCRRLMSKRDLEALDRETLMALLLNGGR